EEGEGWDEGGEGGGGRESTGVGARVQWGILSTADINRKVIPGARASDRVELVAVASRDQERADAYAREWDIPRAHGSYEALLGDPEIEAVHISLPNTLPARGAVKGAHPGEHRLLQKPCAAPPAGE